MHPDPLSTELLFFVYCGIIKDGRVYLQEAEQRPPDASEEFGILNPPSNVWPSSTHFLGGNRRQNRTINEVELHLILFNFSII